MKCTAKSIAFIVSCNFKQIGVPSKPTVPKHMHIHMHCLELCVKITDRIGAFMIGTNVCVFDPIYGIKDSIEELRYQSQSSVSSCMQKSLDITFMQVRHTALR